jgi:hypothetical protein
LCVLIFTFKMVDSVLYLVFWHHLVLPNLAPVCLFFCHSCLFYVFLLLSKLRSCESLILLIIYCWFTPNQFKVIIYFFLAFWTTWTTWWFSWLDVRVLQQGQVNLYMFVCKCWRLGLLLPGAVFLVLHLVNLKNFPFVIVFHNLGVNACAFSSRNMYHSFFQIACNCWNSFQNSIFIMIHKVLIV